MGSAVARRTAGDRRAGRGCRRNPAALPDRCGQRPELGISAIIWIVAYAVFVLVFAFYDPSTEFLGGYQMDLSSAWIGILVYFAILGILNRVWLLPYLLRTKGKVSRDDQLPYFVIPTLITVLSVFLFDAYR